MSNRPNILIFMTDHQRGDTALPEHPALTPNLTAFSRQAVTFTDCYCPSPHCCPSRATFMSGLYPSRHGVWNNVGNGQALQRGLNPGVRLWSEDLRQAGYELAYAGKWHVTAEESPARRGWHELFVSAPKGGEAKGFRWNKYKELAHLPDPARREWGQALRPGWGPATVFGRRDEGNQHDERTVAEAIHALPELVQAGKPWVLYVGCHGPHDPYWVPGKYLDMYDLKDVPLPASYGDRMADKPSIYRRMRQQVWDQLGEEEIRDAVRHFWAFCTYLDNHFGNVLRALEATGQADNTLVLYTSDHGDYCGDHGLFAKGIPCFRGAYHVPAMIRWPKGLRDPGRRVEQFVSLADFCPTFQELAGLKPDAALTGRSLLPFLQGQTPTDWRDDIHTQCDGVELYFTQRSVTTKQYKYVYNGFDFDELYDLRSDPHEMKNLSSDPACAAVKKDMVRRFWRFAYREEDQAANGYITVGLAPWGPAEAFRD